jgi:hypothetical protein
MAKKKRGRGRPKLPKGVGKATVVTLRLQPAERKAVLAAAKRDGQKLSDWMRTALLHRATAIRIENAEAEGAGVQPHR